MLTSLAPANPRSIVFLLSLLYLQAYTVDAAISTSAGFPQDVFAKPAFQVRLGGLLKDTSTLPIKRTDAVRILEQQEASSSSSSSSLFNRETWHSLSVPGNSDSYPSYTQEGNSRTLFWSLQRSSPTELQLCSIPDFTYTPAVKQRRGAPTPPRSKQQLIRNAQALLDPLKKVCLYHTTDWFTYSFCHGKEIRQFRRLGPQSAAHKAFKKAGGGEAGKKAALEAAEKVNSFVHPVADPEYPAFILGRWTPQSEEIVDENPTHQQQPALEESKGVSAVSSSNSANRGGMGSLVNSAGLDLVEEVQFGDWDEEELFAAEAKALSQFKHSDSAIESSSATSSGGESQRHRHLTQRWTNGTMCDMNHQPRTVEVQFHCSSRKPLEDRIVMFKETTICNYVLVIETPRLCADPAFGSETEDKPLPIECHRVVEDSFGGATLGDPKKVQPALGEIDAKEASKSQEQGDGEGEGERKETSSAEEASSTSHTFGDLSRYGSVHDDFFDEALGGHGASFHEYQGEEGLEVGGEEEAEIMVEVSMDEEGRVQVNKVVASSDSATNPDAKEVRRREGGKKRSDDTTNESGDGEEEETLEIQLDLEDLPSVLRGEEGASLESKLAEQISKVLSSKMLQQYGSSDAEDGEEGKQKKEKQKKGKGKGETPDELAKMYNKLMAGVNGAKEIKGSGKVKQGKGAAGKQPRPLRMEKVGDSLSERVKRFYDAKEREEGGDGGKKKEAPPIAEHLEL
ncbi:hypothetical protein NDA11_004561 [Ustilago hordei]|uniref:Protein OS-9 homolog n=1 Tax=Ustilago hordei TaxID=120017 RepID=I2FNY7_USTHO|nr:uncharacterized protein UHO2_05480 [Ustilago hordei]KAJ1039720.1 hypothetical protein NDA10_000713 [Ustilago hordei]KAJ1580346.1 hypothetical protein NDA11_004561 [Ustilago hordei]KAJ1599382.1 hypothetical protein NDA14_000214 [Ustilago hordei]UTT90610.1 hypothetical protein NDA17_005616 [Ustilago hordei]CCF48630.1 uncharacterized protein UHOR_06515 [Ustilago hordei]